MRHPDSEGVLLTTCKQVLSILAAESLLVWRRIHVMPIAIHGLNRFRSNTDMRGMPDLLIWLRGGPVVSVELKAQQGRQSPEQKNFEAALRAVNHKYHVIRTPVEFDEMLQSYGVSHWALGNKPGKVEN